VEKTLEWNSNDPGPPCSVKRLSPTIGKLSRNLSTKILRRSGDRIRAARHIGSFRWTTLAYHWKGRAAMNTGDSIEIAECGALIILKRNLRNAFST
jgi:hypothetical protein